MAGEDDGSDATATETSGGGADATVQEDAPGAPPHSDSALGAVGRFRLESRLGAGGMGDVYRAYDPALDRAVALKVLRARDRTAALPQQMRRVLREARAAAALTHPNTVTIFDVGEADGEVFIAMELLAGETLRSAIRHQRGDFSTKMRWLKEAATALSAAHERGLVHRDVKPDNMFICAPSGTLKLLDFGIAKRDESEIDPEGVTAPDSIGPSSLRTEAGVRVGTPRYMAPEQRAGLGTDARTDQFAWGLVAFELLTGNHPVSAPATVTNPTPGAGGAPALTPAHVRAALARTPRVSKRLAAAIARTLEPLQEDRFASMTELLAALDGDDAPRRRWLWAVPALVGIAGVAGVVRFAPARTKATPLEDAARCHVEGIRTIPAGEDDRIGALPNGDIALAANIRQGLTIRRQLAGDAGMASSVTTNPIALGLLSVFEKKADYDDILLSGIRLGGESWIFATIEQDLTRGPLIVGLSGNHYIAQRITPPVSGVAFSALGDRRLVFAVTTPAAGPRMGGLSDGAEIYISKLDDGPHPINVEEGDAYLPALAVSPDDSRIAFAYALQIPGDVRRQKLELAILDGEGQRLSDVKTVYEAPQVAPAIAFADATRAAAFWVEDLGSSTRLRSATYAPGDPAATPAKNAAPESALNSRPVTGRLPSGAWIAAWIGVPKSTPTLRIAPVTANGDLAGATSVAELPGAVDALTATGSDRGITLSWREMNNGARVVKIAEVTCR